MAAIGKIRSWSVFLVGIIALGLFAFIAEEFFRSCDSSKNNQRQVIGEVLGEKIGVQDFQKLVDEYTDVVKVQQGQDNIPEDMLTQIRDQVWNTYVSNKIIEKEAGKLGLTVTDDEMKNILGEGTNPMLLQTPFVNQQTGRFDRNVLNQFLAQYSKAKSSNSPQLQQMETLYKYWLFIEKTLRLQTLAQKYQGLLAGCFLSNPVEAKMAFKEENEESQVQLAAFPYSDIDDAKVKIDDSDLKAKYNELKLRFKQPIESRDIKYIDVNIVASAADRAALKKEFAGYSKDLAATDDPTEVVKHSNSLVPYLGVPAPKDIFAQYPDISSRLDSMAVGSTYGPYENKQDNTLNLIKLVAKTSLPDSVQVRMINVPSDSADIVLNEVKGGADFAAVAKKFNQTGDSTWVTARQLIGALMQSDTPDQKKMVTAIQNTPANTFVKVDATQSAVIINVIDRKGFKDNYTAAVVKKTIDYSEQTRRNYYNKFSSFVSANDTPELIARNAAKNGYHEEELKDITTSQHNVANVHSTRDVLKWIFDAEEQEVSKMFEVGNNGDHLMLVVLDKIHRAGFRGLDDPQVKELVKSEVIKDKKAEQIMAKLNGVKSLAAAKGKGGKVSTVNQVTFAAPVFVPAVGASEPALSGAVSATKKGQFASKPVKGNAGVYVFQVTGRSMRPGKFNEKAQETKLEQNNMRYAGNFMNELYLNAKVVDNRYLFF